MRRKFGWKKEILNSMLSTQTKSKVDYIKSATQHTFYIHTMKTFWLIKICNT